MIDWDKQVLAKLDEAFGVMSSYQPAAGSAYPLQGIFTDGYKSPGFDEVGAATWNTSAPTLGVRAIDLQAPPTTNDRITIGSKVYQVADKRPDGVGWVVIILKATS